jgi:glycosyltransferase involved in cell wall biosynthesis
MAKYNILVVPSDDRGGVGFYRSLQPHNKLAKLFPDEFDITIDMHPVWTNLAEFDKYNLIHLHKALFPDMAAFQAAMKYCKSKGIVTILDIDDYWALDPHHPQYVSQKMGRYDELIKNNLRLFDYITTTTQLFADEIKKVNPNATVFVIPNAIDPTAPEFQVNKEPNDKVRIGLVMGSSHEHDMELLKGVVNSISGDVKKKMQIVLCGFDTRGTSKLYDHRTGRVIEERPIEPKETVWYRYEQNVSDNWKLTTPQYKQFLDMFIPGSEYPSEKDEFYRRCWTKDMDHYYEHFSKIDILLAPLQRNQFNKVKSQLKCIEAGFSHTAIIASDFGPYTIDLKPYLLFGGAIDETGNAMMVKEGKDHKDWRRYIEYLVKNPDALKKLQDNLYETVREKYNLNNVTKNRAEIYRTLIETNKKAE